MDLVIPVAGSPAFGCLGSALGRESLIRVLVGLVRYCDEETAGAAAAQDGGRDGVRRVPPRPAEALL